MIGPFPKVEQPATIPGSNAAASAASRIRFIERNPRRGHPRAGLADLKWKSGLGADVPSGWKRVPTRYPSLRLNYAPVVRGRQTTKATKKDPRTKVPGSDVCHRFSRTVKQRRR